jgi:hypothetical protein
LFRRPPGFSWRVNPPEIIDSEGNRPKVRSGDGGADGDGYVDAELELRGTIAPEAAWLEIDGTRVGLARRTARSEVRIEVLEDRSPMERFLWRRLAVPEWSGQTTDLEPMIEALVAARAVDEGSRLVEDLRAVAARMPGSPLHRRPLPGGSARSLVEPWGSVLRRLGRHDGPQWTLVLDALTPSCDGVQLAANSITSDLGGFEVAYEVVPNVLVVDALDELPVAWWARDDRGNHYLGAPGDRSISDTGAQGAMHYWPALDPRAKRLDLLLCVDSHQAVISISVPESGGDSR